MHTISIRLLGITLTWLTLSVCAEAAPKKIFGWVEEGVIEPEHISIKIKLDTGALTSSLDARDLTRFSKDGESWVRFKMEVTDSKTGNLAVALFERPVERRVKVRGAGGTDRRPIVFMDMCIGDRIYHEEFSLNDRGKMLYPALIGRRTIEHLGLVDVSRTFTREPSCKREKR